jgi:hypothetical protein
MTVYAPGTAETDPKKQNRAIQAAAAQVSANTTDIATNAAAIAALQSGTVTTIAGNSGAFTLNAASGITNATNDIKLSQASSTQFGAVKVDNTTITAASGVLSTVNPLPTPIHASLGSDVALNNIANYFDGPSIAQGTTGTWFASGTVTVVDSAGAANFNCKLWDGTTVIASAKGSMTSAGFPVSVSLSGYIASPAGNIRISVNDPNSTSGAIKFNASGNSKDSTISAFRIA